MSDSNNPNNFLIAVRRIKDISFNINENIFVPNTKKEIKIGIQHELSFNIDRNLIFFNLRCFFHFADASPIENIIDITVQNVFEMPQLNHFVIDKNTVNLSFEVLLTIISISIGHTRALLAKNTSGTVCQDMLLPIMNAVDLTKELFPNAPLNEKIEEEVRILRIKQPPNN